ncbi:MAG: hypothetical protein ACKKMS_00285 [Candidatus Nealsonbacteria bacterium]
MEPIKRIAGKILLYLYYIQRDDYAYLNDFLLSFQMRGFLKGEKSPAMDNREHKICKSLIEISRSDNDIYNALIYLHEKGFISMSRSQDNVSEQFLNIRVSSEGIDMIEGIERGEKERQEFHITFNIKLADNINIESLIKAELGSLIKASLV